MSDTLTETFNKLFSGRTDAYGSWEGGSIKNEVTTSTFVKHLWGQEYIGIYPLMDDSTVNWGCSDIDVDDIDQARNLQTALQIKDITSWVEKTVRGYHVWVFADKPVPAWIMRRALLITHAVVRVPAKEINPKQEVSVGLGNYVRLPYPGTLLEPCTVRYMIDNNDNAIPFETFIATAVNCLTPQKNLEKLATQYVVRQPAVLNTTVTGTPLDVALASINPYAAAILLNGPLEGHDRSSILCTLGFSLKESNMPIDEALGILITADKRWGKYHSRKDGMERLTKLIEFVYGS